MVSFRLRAADPEDFLMLWQWRNDPVTRAMERVTEAVSLVDYSRWLAAILANDRQRLYLAIAGSTDAVGMSILSFHHDDSAQIGLNINPACRGRRLATPLILETIGHGRAALGFRQVEALIRAENMPSRRAFARAGFQLEDADLPIVRMVRDLEADISVSAAPAFLDPARAGGR